MYIYLYRINVPIFIGGHHIIATCITHMYPPGYSKVLGKLHVLQNAPLTPTVSVCKVPINIIAQM